MAKNITDYDLVIKTPKAKLNYLIKAYLASNYSQNFVGDHPISFKKSLSISVNDVNELISNVTKDLAALLEPYFNSVDLDVVIIEHGSSWTVGMDIVCDGVSFKNDVSVSGLKIISRNIFLDMYYKED